MHTKRYRLLSIEGLEPRLVMSTYYVSLTGSDNNPGTLSQPFATINHGAGILQPGDTLYVRAGTYAESLIDAIPGGTSWSAAVTIAAYSGETVTLRPSAGPDSVLFFSTASEEFIIVKGLIIDATNVNLDAVKITYSSGAGAANHIRFQNDEIENAQNGMGVLISNDPAAGNNTDYNEFISCKIHDNGSNALEHGLYINSNHNLIDGCDVYRNAGYGIHFFKYDTGPSPVDESFNIVRNNRVHDNGLHGNSGSSGILFSNGDSNLAYSNIVWNNPRGIVVDFGATNTDIFNNTIYNNNLGEAGIDITWGTNTVVENNIAFQNANGDYLNNATGTIQDHNLFAINPLFVNAAGNDFHLQAGSPAIDAGATLTQVPVDFDGIARPQGPAYDIGAYEFHIKTPHLQIVAGATATAGLSFSLTVTAQDANNNTLTSYLGTVHFTSTDAAAILPSNYTFTAADAGVHTFIGVILKTAGSQTITATDTVTSSITGNAPIAVNPAAASALVLAGYPSSVTAGTSHNFTITARDAFGNTAGGYTGTVAFTSTDGQAVLPANYTFTGADAGQHTFSTTLKTAGNQSITATDTVTSSLKGSQTGITVNPAAANKLVASGYASPTTAGVSHSFTVTAQDAFGNTASSYTGTVAFTSSDAQAVLPANYKFISMDAGGHSFSTTLRTVGSQSITATDTVTSSTAGTESGITVNPAAMSGLRLSAPASVTAGQAFTVTVTAVDLFGNVINSYLGTIHFISSDNQAVLSTDYTFKSAAAGAHVFTNGVTLKTAGSQTVIVTDTVTSSLTGQATITVNSGTLMPALFARSSSDGQVWGAVSNGSSAFVTSSWAVMSTGVTWVDVLMGDFNGDGKTDIVARAAQSGDVWVGLSNGSGFQFSRWTTWSTSVNWVDVRVGDFNGDGKADLVARVRQTGQLWVGQSTGNAFSESLWATWSTAASWTGISVGDFNGDGKDDIADFSLGNGQWWVAQSNGKSFSTAQWAAWSTGATWVDFQVADFNGDGKADITARALQNGQWYTAISNGTNAFTTSLWATWSTGATWVDVKVGDFNGDGKADIIGRALQNGQWYAGLSNGSAFNTSFWAAWSTGATWVDVQVGDFNRDGRSDIVGRAMQNGQWYAGLSNSTAFNTSLWATWSTSVNWVDVRLAKNL